MPVHRWEGFLFSLFELLMQWKWSTNFRSLKLYTTVCMNFLIALSVLFGFYVSFPCSSKKRKCSTWVQNEILDLSLSLGEEIEPLWYTNTHTNTLTDKVMLADTHETVFLFLAISCRIWWREPHDSSQNTSLVFFFNSFSSHSF